MLEIIKFCYILFIRKFFLNVRLCIFMDDTVCNLLYLQMFPGSHNCQHICSPFRTLGEDTPLRIAKSCSTSCFWCPTYRSEWTHFNRLWFAFFPAALRLGNWGRPELFCLTIVACTATLRLSLSLSFTLLFAVSLSLF